MKVMKKSFIDSYDCDASKPPLKSERKHYDRVYREKNIPQLKLHMVAKAWYDETEPWCKTLLDSLGDLSGKRILLLGNGESIKELYFLHQGAIVLFTDLSIEAVRHMSHAFSFSELNCQSSNTIWFLAVDAMQLPFPDSSFDIIYGSAFVHHLDDVDTFLSEVHRCLKDNGICRFFDQANSPLWDTMKRTVLRPF